MCLAVSVLISLFPVGVIGNSVFRTRATSRDRGVEATGGIVTAPRVYASNGILSKVLRRTERTRDVRMASGWGRVPVSQRRRLQQPRRDIVSDEESRVL